MITRLVSMFTRLIPITHVVTVIFKDVQPRNIRSMAILYIVFYLKKSVGLVVNVLDPLLVQNVNEYD